MADPPVPQSPFSRPVDDAGPAGIATSIMSTPGARPVFDTTNIDQNGLTFREVGVSGLRAFSGWVREEPLLELQGRQGAQKYREMGDNSPIIGALLFAIQSTMRKVEWRVIPNEDAPQGAAQEAADFLESCMNDMSHTWTDLIIENLSALQYGYAPHEIVYKRRLGKTPPKLPNGIQQAASDYDDGLVGWRRIPIRGQDTIIQWFFTPTGSIQGVRQLPWTGTMRDIAIEKMLLFRPISYKNNPEGRSILRTAYQPYYYIKRLQELEAILGERMGGVPVVRIPLAMIQAAATDKKAAASYDSFKKLAVNLRIDEQMGVVLPSDTYPGVNGPSAAEQYKLELVTPQGGGRGSALNFEVAINRYTVNILTSVLADFLTLGHEARGTQSLAVTKVDLFFQAVEGYLNSFADVYNRYAVERLWTLNGMDPNVMPKIEPDLAQRVDLDVLSNFVLRLSQAGMPMFPNEELQTFLLDAGGMPDVTDPMALQAAGLLDEQLDQKDEMADVELDNAKNPPQQKPMSNLDKMLLKSLAQRMIRSSGPRFGVSTAKAKQRNKHNGAKHHV